MEKSRLFRENNFAGADFATPSFFEELTKGQHIVLGAPGSGKSSLLTHLVTKLESQGANPHEILVITPSRRGASRLRDVIALNSGQAAAEPRARSLAAWAFAQHRKLNPNLRLISGSAQQELIRKLVRESSASPWGLDPATVKLEGFLQEARDLFTVCLEHKLSPVQLQDLANKYELVGLRLAAELIPKYLDEIAALDSLDPSQLVTTCPIDKVPKWILVDDAQDISPAGLALIASHQDVNLVLFGDPDAQVLGFRAGDSDGFISNFPMAKRHYLEYHGVNAQHLAKLSQKLPTNLAGLQRPKGAGSSSLSARLFSNQVEEADWIAAEIRKTRLKQSITFSEFAVVARTRVQLEQIASQLSARGVPTQIVGVQLALREQFLASAVLQLASISLSGFSSAQISNLLQSSLFGLTAVGVRRLSRQLAAMEEFSGVPRAKLLEVATQEIFEPSSSEQRQLQSLKEKLQVLGKLADGSAFELISEALKLINFDKLAQLARGASESALAANRDIDSALELVAAAQRFDQNQQGKAREFVKSQLEQSVPEDSLAPVGMRDAVQLTTAAGLIDQSFRHVFIPRLQDGIWPNLRPRNSLLGAQSLSGFLTGRLESPLELSRSELVDEIRLFYKTIGAARDSVVLSAMVSLEEQPSQFFELLKLEAVLSNEPVHFDLRRLVGNYRRRLIKGDFSMAPRLAALALLQVPGAHPSNWQGLLPLSTGEPLVGESEIVRFSPSKLDAFEKCPVHWFISNFGGDSSNFEASVGTLLHTAMELSSEIESIQGYLESNWHTLEFETEWLANSQRRKAMKMAAAISLYLKDSDPLLAAEQKFELNLDDLQIAGKIDRLELTSNGSVRVVDLKTGRVPTQADVASHRQLAVYQLAMRQAGQQVAGGRVIAVGDQKLKVLDQPALDAEAEKDLRELLRKVAREAGGASFIANYYDHCQSDGTCQLLISKVVTSG